MQRSGIFAIEMNNIEKESEMVNHVNAVFALQAMQMQCANEVLDAHRDYEESLVRQQQNTIEQDSIYNDYNGLVDDYNKLLRHARSLAASLKKSNECIDNAKQQFDLMDAHIASLNEQIEDKNNRIRDLSDELNNKTVQVEHLQSNLLKNEDQMRETIFTLTLVNTVLSTQSLAFKAVINEWSEGKVYQKHKFLTNMQEKIKQLDLSKNKSGSTNSTEAIAYLKLNNQAVFLKVFDLIL